MPLSCLKNQAQSECGDDKFLKELDAVRDFLKVPTPEAWCQQALVQQELLLIDHAHCEKKSASTALNLMYRYVQHSDLQFRMSRIAREELRHYERVLKILSDRNIQLRHLTASRYAGGMRKLVRTRDPERLVDVLIVGAFIEARSCERFSVLIPHLDQKLANFYFSLLKSEARHYQDNLSLAKQYAEGDIEDRVEVFRSCEAELIISPDAEFRFHSGVPN
jgi:tRNA-(ms[2]io[6]A)-hydroxylase